MSIEIKLAYDEPEEIGKLFTEYTNNLVQNDPMFQEYLQVQNYDEEIKHLEHKYGMPEGRLYIAYVDGKVAGCIGLRKIDDENCEMKRLYVRPEFRGKHLGNELMQKIIEDAKQIGYQHMLLDTLPFLKNALEMYRKAGFYEISCYNNSPMDTSIYMKLDLNNKTQGENAMDFKLVDKIEEKDEKEIFEGLKAYNMANIEDTNYKDLGIYLEDENGKKQGGIIAETHGNWLTVHYLWVAESMRGKRMGETLLQKAEEEAKRRGCKYCFLDTFSFQAPEFYKKYGYKVVFTLEEYPVSGKRYYFTKKL